MLLHTNILFSSEQVTEFHISRVPAFVDFSALPRECLGVRLLIGTMDTLFSACLVIQRYIALLNSFRSFAVMDAERLSENILVLSVKLLLIFTTSQAV